jgi:hypothetical protein
MFLAVPLLIVAGQGSFAAAPNTTWKPLTLEGMSVDDCVHRSARVLENNGYKVAIAGNVVTGRLDPHVALVFCAGAPSALLVLATDGTYEEAVREANDFDRRIHEHAHFRGREGGQLAGAWNWYNGQTVVIYVDHTCDAFIHGDDGDRKINSCSWERIGEGRFRLTWQYHGYVNTVALSDDGDYVDDLTDKGPTRFSRR